MIALRSKQRGFLLNPYRFGAESPGDGDESWVKPGGNYRVPLTVLARAKAVSDYQLYVNLQHMPAAFWDHLYYGRGQDIRVRNAAGADLPFDLVSLSGRDKKGVLFVRASLGASATLYIHYGNPVNQRVPYTAPHGRNAVWAGFDRVFMFGGEQENRTGGPGELALAGPGSFVDAMEIVSSMTPTVAAASVALSYDALTNEYFSVNASSIQKVNAAFTAVAASNNSAMAGVGFVGALTDAVVVGKVLYAVAVSSDASAKRRALVAYKTSDLSLLSVTPFSYAAGVTEIPGASARTVICYNEDDRCFYLGTEGVADKLWRMSKSAKLITSTLNFSVALSSAAGPTAIAYGKNLFYISQYGETLRVIGMGGDVQGVVAVNTAPAGFSAMDYDRGELIARSPDSKVLRIASRDISMPASLGMNISGSAAYCSAAPRNSEWTVGISANRTLELPSTSAIASYTDKDYAGSDRREVLAAQGGSNFGLWNATDGWSSQPAALVINTAYRLHATHSGTVRRQLFNNGVLVASKDGVSQRPGPSVVQPMLYFGIGEGADVSQRWAGVLGYAYLYAGILPPERIEAEALNLSNPGSFYSVGTEESLPL